MMILEWLEQIWHKLNMVKKPKQQPKKQGAPSKPKTKGWQRVDLEDFEIEGFEDGNAFELEELTEYTLEDDGFGGRILKAAAPTPGKKNKGAKPAKSPAVKTSTSKPSQESNAVDETTDENEPTDPEDDINNEAKGKKKKKKGKKNKTPQSNDATTEATTSNDEEKEPDDQPADEDVPVLPEWAKFNLHPTLNASLTRLGFTSPTNIQALTLVPAMIDHRDVVGAAPTGSGKTLAFGMPVLHHLLSKPENRGKCRALILTPTRELAMQIVEHLQALVPDKRRVGIVALVGGMAVQKQLRQLSYRPEVVVATPGRLWEVMEAGETKHFDALNKDLQFLIVDEADRMLQQGSFPQLQQIFERVNKGKADAPTNEDDKEDGDDDENDGSVAPAEASLIMLDDVLKQQDGKADDDDDEEAEEAPAPPETQKNFVRQTFLFSATMTLKNAGRFQTKKMKNPTALTMLETIMKRIGLRGKPAVVDLSAKEARTKDDKSRGDDKPRGSEVTLPAGLELAQVECLDVHRNNVLYYFLTQYPGRTIVFLNAISGVRKLAGVLQLLKLPVFALHAEMQQKQRLKKLEQFRAHDKGILIATDVAARGLDIPSVEYVVHYHIPRSAETFVHRSGRTARASQEGLSLSFVAPIDAKYHAQICSVLHRPSGFSVFPVDHKFLPVIKERVKLAEQIFASDNSDNKQNAEATWFSQMAQAADLPFDEDEMAAVAPAKKDKHKTQALRANLHHLLLEPLRPIGSKRKFYKLHEDLKSNKISTDGEYSTRDATADLMQKSKKHSLKRFRKR
ncbi:hypothetical protein AeRB84_005275 [Aphanomyces euteiches]|nr:hypothetical protein AeRB84_005275 [Aphanomyces euteiches]